MTVVALVVAAALTAADETAPIRWRQDIPQALTEAEEHGRPLLVRFQGTPCGRWILPGERDALGRRVQGDYITDCDRMENEVWSHASIMRAAARFVPVLTTLRTLNDRYNVVTSPTVIFADPWGNEIVRLVGYTRREVVERVLEAVPNEFSAAEGPGRALQRDPHDATAFARLARFYESAGLREFADRFYERALLTDAVRLDGSERRRLVVARGTNLLGVGKAAEAADLFRKEAESEKRADLGDVLLFGWMMAELRQGRLKDAERPFNELVRRFPASRYAARAKENMEAARRP
jgi:hypothetical protein